MTTILASAAATAADQELETLATYAAMYGNDQGGTHLRTALLAVLIRRLFDVPAADAIDMARHGDDPRADAADLLRAELLDRARTALQNASETWTPQRGDTVTWNGVEGVWTVRGREDDDTVWIHRLDIAMVPAYGRTGSGLVDLTPHRREPAHEELVVIADLRPVEDAEAGR